MVYYLEQVSRALEGGASGAETIALLPRLLTSHFDLADTGSGYAKLRRGVVLDMTPITAAVSILYKLLHNTGRRTQRYTSTIVLS